MGMSAKPVIVEAYVETAAQAVAAVAAGASRLELCGPGEGGLTPAATTLDAVRERALVPIHVMIRPRAGDFVYRELELEEMRLAIGGAKAAGAAGVVLGVLNADGTLDGDRMAALVALARPLRVICHRAFDETPDADAALETLLSLGVDGVLTSGHARTALLGGTTIARHVARAGSRLEVIAGGSVRAPDARTLVEATGVTSVHARGTDAVVIADLVRALRSGSGRRA